MSTPARLRLAASALALPLLAGCNRVFSAMHPLGPQAERISDLTWYLVIVGTAVFLTVTGFLLYALRRGSRREESASGE